MRLIDVHNLDILGYLEEFPQCESDKAWNAAIREVCTYVNLAPEVDAVPVIELIALRDDLYESDQITMNGLRKLNTLIGKYTQKHDGGADYAAD